MNFLFKKIDNSSLIVFRVFFGLILLLEAWGSMFTGWIHQTYIIPTLHFSYIGLEFIQPLEGFGMYYLYFFMGLMGLGVMLGYFYRISIVTYTVLWTYCYLCHKISYNNHYYLMILLCLIMCFLPANQYASLDVKYKRIKQNISMPYWCKFILIFQITCVYVFGAIAKLYPDWMDGTFAFGALQAKSSFPLIGQFFTQKWFYMGIAYGGFLFDLLIIPMLFYKKTRKLGFVISVFFHSFNSIVFQVGVFPYLSMSFALFFFVDKKINRWFLPVKAYFESEKSIQINKRVVYVLVTYVFVQLLLPLRQHLIKGNTYWTDEGHKMSWRMMLRSTSGTLTYKIKDLTQDRVYWHRLGDELSHKQKRLIKTHPDVIWQYAQYLKKKAALKGNKIEVYAISKKSLNRRKYQQFIDPKVDLAHTPWQYFSHATWIRPFKGW